MQRERRIRELKERKRERKIKDRIQREIEKENVELEKRSLFPLMTIPSSSLTNLPTSKCNQNYSNVEQTILQVF